MTEPSRRAERRTTDPEREPRAWRWGEVWDWLRMSSGGATVELRGSLGGLDQSAGMLLTLALDTSNWG